MVTTLGRLAGGLLALLMALGGAAEAANRVAFERENGVWILDEGRGAPRRVAEGCAPSLSPDGRRLALIAPCAGEAQTLSVHDLGTGVTDVVLRPGGYLRDPRWSPDGTRIAVMIVDAKTGDPVLHLVDPARRAATRLAGPSGGGLFVPSWLPDGTGLVAHDMVSVFRIGLDGGIREKVAFSAIGDFGGQETSADSFIVDPRDPQALVFTHPSPGTAVFRKVIDEASRTLVWHDRTLGRGKNLPLTPPEITAFDPVWSPDGAFVYFSGYRDVRARDAHPFRVWRVERTGRGLTELATGERPSVAPLPK